ncbi:MAG: response regulator [Gammaproteobacteria bacterium]|nr:response regulator [Gammaproteobacteria bacterium]MBT3719634.1 response regulator [Gammaproteobacteria bacterium]MBT3844608.1 response regulator [Gammaproteobacteria bacterium]MBT3892226.1 response regulator [Gammaproteobacteria bacterium]MBT4301905.1 response regulator [Gammaproteobacteria bacterium]
MSVHSNQYNLLAIDDDPKVLDAYNALFPQGDEWMMSSIMSLTGSVDHRESDDEHIEFKLECCESGQNGLEIVRQGLINEEPIAVIFLDMRMPNGWSGLETAREIRKIDEHVRIVLVSAYTDYTLEEIRSEIGHRFVFHSKPWNDEELEQLTRLLVSDWDYENELRQTQRQLEDATVAAVNANRSKDQFLASMSHELRTPLTALLGYGELLGETPLQQEQKSLLQTMQVSGNSLLYLLNDMLDLSKIAAGKFEVDQVEFDLGDTIHEVEQIFTVRAENQGLSFEVMREGSGIEFSSMLMGDGKRIAQILINLISNAIKFTHEGYVRLKVTSADGFLYFRVEDSGIGMQPEVMGRLFKPFEQADRSISGRFGGTGLGLHISQTLAQLMEGEITVTSVYGQGAIFELKIPLVLGSRETAVNNPLQKGQSTERLQGEVLVAEDTPELQFLIRKMIEVLGITVHIAENGRLALEMAMQHNYDLILMDMQMPEMDGVEATQQLRAKLNSTPVIALTANVMQHQRDAFQQAGCDGFLPKPIQKTALQGVLRKYLNAVEVIEKIENEHELELENMIPVSSMMDGLELDDELMLLFTDRITTLRDELEAARAAGEWEQVQKLVHTIKGSVGSYGYLQVSDVAAEAEGLLENQDQEGYEKKLDVLNQQLLSILNR